MNSITLMYHLDIQKINHLDSLLGRNTEERIQTHVKKGKPSSLTKERIASLNKLGFVWHILDAAWEGATTAARRLPS